MAAASGSAGAGRAGASGTSRFLTLFLLFLGYTNYQWSRFLLSYLYGVSCEDVSSAEERSWRCVAAATGMSTAQYGFLSGFGFALIFAPVSLLGGRAVDVYNRKHLIVASMVLWNAAGFIMAAASGFAVLLCSRIVLGIGQALFVGAVFSTLADVFPVHERSRATALFLVGMDVANAFGAMSIQMDTIIGWRATCVVVSVFGVLVAILYAILCREPERVMSTEADDTGDVPPFGQALKEVVTTPLMYGVVLFVTARATAFEIQYVYYPDFFATLWPEREMTYSIALALIYGLAGTTSALAGGWFMDKAYENGFLAARIDVPILGCIAGLPLYALSITAKHFSWAVIFLALAFLFSECWFGAAGSLQQNFFPSRVRGVGYGLVTLGVNLGLSISVYLMGLKIGASEGSDHEGSTMRNTFAVGMIVTLSVSLLSLFILRRAFKKWHAERGSDVDPAAQSRTLLAGKSYSRVRTDNGNDDDDDDNNNGDAGGNGEEPSELHMVDV